MIRSHQGKEDPSKNRGGNNLENMGNSMDHLPGQKLSGQGSESLRTGQGLCPGPQNQLWVLYKSLFSVFMTQNPLLSNRI